MSQLVAYYGQEPVDTKGSVEVTQHPISSASGIRSVEGAVRTGVVYVLLQRHVEPLLIPFADFEVR